MNKEKNLINLISAHKAFLQRAENLGDDWHAEQTKADIARAEARLASVREYKKAHGYETEDKPFSSLDGGGMGQTIFDND